MYTQQTEREGDKLILYKEKTLETHSCSSGVSQLFPTKTGLRRRPQSLLCLSGLRSFRINSDDPAKQSSIFTRSSAGKFPPVHQLDRELNCQLIDRSSKLTMEECCNIKHNIKTVTFVHFNFQLGYYVLLRVILFSRHQHN